MIFRIFLPLLLLILIQLFGFFFYYKFNYNFQSNNNIAILVFLMYLALMVPVIFLCFMKNRTKKTNFMVADKYNYFFIIITLIFLLRPLVLLFGIGFEFGFEYLRVNYYTDDKLRSLIYGHPIIATLINLYVVPILWAYLILISNAINKSSKFAFYFILIFLVLFNLSYGGRFNIYFALLILYYRSVIMGGGVLTFLKKYLFLISILIISSFLMLINRRNEDIGFLERGVLEVLEYHILPPFVLAQSIDLSVLNYEGFPFRTIIYSFFAPLGVIFDIDGKLLPYTYYAALLSEFRLHSFNSGSWYNAFGTFFNFFYVDSGFLAPLFIFIFITYLLFSSYLISDIDKRNKFLIYISFMLYSSLFQAPIMSPGVIFVIFIFPFLSKLLKWK